MHFKYFSTVPLNSLELIFCLLCFMLFFLITSILSIFNILGFGPIPKLCGGCHGSLGERRLHSGKINLLYSFHSLDYSQINSYFI